MMPLDDNGKTLDTIIHYSIKLFLDSQILKTYVLSELLSFGIVLFYHLVPASLESVDICKAGLEQLSKSFPESFTRLSCVVGILHFYCHHHQCIIAIISIVTILIHS